MWFDQAHFHPRTANGDTDADTNAIGDGNGNVTSTSTPTSTPTNTPTPAPLQPAEIFDLISPSVAFIETASGSGSGVLVEGGYIVTNAHVVWPFAEVRVVFADGTEHKDVPVENWDLMGDLAVVGPVETEVSPIELVDGEELIIGSEIYLIGYPGEVDEFPQPTITRGLISRLREWEPIGVTFFQTDAMVAGGQSGGVLVSELGYAIGISGFSFSEADFGLVASAADIGPRIKGLLDGDDVAGLGDRWVPLEGGKLENNALLYNEWDTQLFVINQPVGTEVKFEIHGSDLSKVDYAVMDVLGYFVAAPEASSSSSGRGTVEIEMEAPYFLDVFQNTSWIQNYVITSSHSMIPYDDPDDGRRVELGETIAGSLDYPGDWDYYEIYLDAGELINIQVDSVLVDPYLEVGQPGDEVDQMVGDDDTAGGMFGTDAELTYETPHDGKFVLTVRDAYGWLVGGYYLSIDTPYDGAPTPMAPKPTATPIMSEYGEMNFYESDFHPFVIEHPADWIEKTDVGMLSAACEMADCRVGDEGLLAIVVEDLETLGLGLDQMSLEAYMDLYLTYFVDTNEYATLLSRETRQTAQGEPVEVVVIELMEGVVTAIRMTTLHEGLAFNASYMIMGGFYEELLPMIEYSFSSFRVTGVEE